MPDCPACGENVPDVPAEPDPDAPDAPLLIDGTVFVMEKLSFGERKRVRLLLRDIVKYDAPDADPDEDWTVDDLRLAFAMVCARRANPDFSIEDGLKLTPEELRAVDPPTKPAAKPRAAKAKPA